MVRTRLSQSLLLCPFYLFYSRFVSCFFFLLSCVKLLQLNTLKAHRRVAVASVAANTPAYRAGLRAGDVLVTMNGHRVKKNNRNQIDNENTINNNNNNNNKSKKTKINSALLFFTSFCPVFMCVYDCLWLIGLALSFTFFSLSYRCGQPK